MRHEYGFLKRQTRILSVGIAVLGTVLMVGCGSSADSTPAATSQAPQATPTPNSNTASADAASPESVVAQFLDGVRRGGAAAEVGRLMTKKSQEQYDAVGLVMQPIGAPDAKFEIARSQLVGENEALVLSLWTEAAEGGETTTYQVLWALKRETEGWRVSGLVLEDETAFNFESREDVLAIKQMQDATNAASQPAASTAERPGFAMPPLN